jgi:predicted metal-dependent phosphoesterase TrpH
MTRENSLYVDLHIHSSFSDGTCSIRELCESACAKNLRAIAITDHDCTAGYPEAYNLGRECGLEVITGVELSSEINGVDIHILGYGMDITHPAFAAKLAEMKEARYERAKKIVANLNRMGLDLRFETVLNVAGQASIGRPHIATAMLREELVYSFREAFDKYIGYESPAYVGKLLMSPKNVFDLIRTAGGLPVLAHPGVTKVDERIAAFANEGLAGIEVYHSEHQPEIQKHYKKIAQKHNLFITGGSDFHSATHVRAELGHPAIPYEIVEKLREAYRTAFGRELL